MNLRSTHHGYAYQDLITGIAFVDLMLGTVQSIAVDTKGFAGDRFDDLNVTYRAGMRVRVQIKHTTQDRGLTKATFSADGRSLKLNKLFDSLLHDLAGESGTSYRVLVRDSGPDEDLAKVLRPVGRVGDPGDPLPGVTTRRFGFDPQALRAVEPWKSLVRHLTDDDLQTACDHLVVDTSAPASSLDFASPGPAERALLRRVTEELGAGRTPNTMITPEFAALALVQAATAARALDGNVSRDLVAPRVGLVIDFGAVAEGHPIERAVAVPRVGAVAEMRGRIDAALLDRGRVVVTGEPGAGKSWLCEQIADFYRDEGVIVARHHCWLGATDSDRGERVLTDVVIGSLLRQLEQSVPESTASLRPRFAATSEALAGVIRACRELQSERKVLLIVDGLDHVDRVLGRNTIQTVNPSRLLVEELAAIELPPGVCMVIASQPGPHLDSAVLLAGKPVEMPPMEWEEVHSLARKYDLLHESAEDGLLGEEDRSIVDIVYNRSGGNALYATYLCRYGTRASPLDTADISSAVTDDIVHRLSMVPDTASDLDTYYAHLLSGLTDGQEYAIGALALCDFALSADELGEVLPDVKPLLVPALKALAPVLNSQPGLGGLRIHHESFSRHILNDRDGAWVASLRGSVAAWLSDRGFFMDARAFRNLPELLAQLDRYDELKELVQPGFVAEGIRAFQPPEALVRVVGIVARESEARSDWPTLITCVETRKSIDTYETESLSDSVVEYADVVVSIVGADMVAERLMYDGRPTFPSRWGLRICEAVDKAGVAAPWKAYIEAREFESEREHVTYSSDRDGSLHLASQLGMLRLRGQRGDMGPDVIADVAENLELDHDASLEDLVKVFADGLPAGFMPKVAAAMTDSVKAARVYLTLADLSARGAPGFPSPTDLAREALSLAPVGDAMGHLRHAIPAVDVLAGWGITDLEADLRTTTAAILGGPTVDYDKVQRWLSLVTLAHSLDRTVPLKYGGQLAGVGFYRAWLRYTLATIGVAADVADGVTTPEAASTAVRIALADLAAEAKPFTGKPRACDLYFIHPLIHQTIENSLVVVQTGDLDTVLEHLIAIGDGTTTSTMGLAANGPLTTNDLLKILSQVADHIGVHAVHALMNLVRERRDDTDAYYGSIADFELATARICLAADAMDEARECWRRACTMLAGYGGHKDPTISEIIDSVDDLAAVDIDVARASLAKLVDLTYLVRQHTDGRGTAHFVNLWWEAASKIDPTSAAADAASILLTEPGLEDARAYTAQTHLLQNLVKTADPVVIAALRLTMGTGWRGPDTDLELLTRLDGECGVSTERGSMLAMVANMVAASYDDQPMLYTSDQPKSVASSALIDAAVRLGGPVFSVRTPRADEERNARWDFGPETDQLSLQKRLVADQRPFVPEGRAGAVVAAREFAKQRYRDDGAPRWDVDALAGALGWRIVQATLAGGPKAGIELIDDIARELPKFGDNEVLAMVGEGLAFRSDDANDAMKTVASYCLTLAYLRIRGGGGWRAFAGREWVHLWSRAYSLDPATAKNTLAAAVAGIVNAEAQSSYGVTQAVIASFAATPTDARDGTAADCWQAAFSVIQHRLPGTPERFGHVYRPTTSPDAQDGLNVAVATLAIATVSQPMRADLRQALVATTLLVTLRPTIGQAALVRVLGSGDLDAGRITWLLDIVEDHLRPGELTDDMAAELTKLAGSDWLSVRSIAGKILDGHGHSVPGPPATGPAPRLRAAIRNHLEDEL